MNPIYTLNGTSQHKNIYFNFPLNYNYRPNSNQSSLATLFNARGISPKVSIFSANSPIYQASDRSTNSSSTSLPTSGPVLSFHNIAYRIKVRNKGSVSSRKESILHGVSGIFRPGMNAIMGPTGCGKTTLLDILANRKEKQATSGVTLVDGSKQTNNFKAIAGYVVQDDLIMGTLTVRENLMFSANMRLPPQVSTKEKKERVEKIIQQLGLTKCADTKVGTEFMRGVSGGERKRTCIGMELVVSPSILFLDEPTTGLDASTANSVMALLHRLSRDGLTVIFSIHQPRYSIFKLFDTLMLLASGNVIYHGNASLALKFFSMQNFQCEEHDNPPDFFLDVINGDITNLNNLSNHSSLHKPSHRSNFNESLQKTRTDVYSLDEDSGVFEEGVGKGTNGKTGESKAITKLKNRKVEPGNSDSFGGRVAEDYEKDSYLGGIVEEEGGGVMAVDGDTSSEVGKRAVVNMLVHNYKNSETCVNTKGELDAIMMNYRKSLDTKSSSGSPKYVTSFCRQYFYVSQRTLKNALRNPSSFIAQLLMMLLFGFVVGGFFYDVTDDVKKAFSDRAGAFFFIIIIQMFGNLSAIELFLKERKLFLHESKNGFYRVSVYFLSKIFFDLIPLRVFPLFLFCIISYFLMDLVIAADKFFIFFLTLFLTTITSAALTFVISSFFEVLAVANILVGLSYIIMTLFAGLLISVSSIPKWLSWLQYLSIVRYSFKTLLINEITNATYFVYINNTRVSNDTQQSQLFLRSQEIGSTGGWELWQNMLALAITSVLLLLICYLQLLRLASRR